MIPKTAATTTIKSVLFEKRVKGAMKFHEKNNYTKPLQEASIMIEKLSETGSIDLVVTYNDKLKTNDFDAVKELTSEVRHSGVRNMSIQVMFRVKRTNKISELGLSQEV